MPISVTCDECFRDYSVPERFAGRKVKCKGCGATMTVPDGVEVAEDDNEFADVPMTAPAAPLPAGRSRSKPAAKAADSSIFRSAGFWIAAIAGSVMVGILVCCGGGVLWVRSTIDAGPVEIYANQPEHGDPTTPFPVAKIPVPLFPDLGEPTPIDGSDVQTYFVDLGANPANDGAAGMKMSMRVYLPPGEHDPQSLACVLVAPAGTDLLSGMSLDDGDYHDETLPYAEAGMAVIHYSIDGADEVSIDDENPVSVFYLHFRAAAAGIVNTRNAFEFALAKLPMVDPQKIYTAGHSSAGTLALLAAEHESRLAGAIAYAPAADVESRLKELAEAPMLVTAIFPKVKEFVTQSSPTTHAAILKQPVFLFHAKDDGNVPFADTQRFADRLRENGTDVTLETVETGDHYDPMISDGIPRAIEWISDRSGT
ncbi:MAG: prolyl oligopeptidase family serine peptidase [Planctomycetaceae bacterium]